jgi:hypothetical protein
MKKILVLLLVFATAAGLFALDGEWSLSGSARIGTFVNFENDPISVVGSSYHQPYDYWGPIIGALDVNYTMDALKIGLGFQTANQAQFVGNLEYDGGNFKFQAKQNLYGLLTGTNYGFTDSDDQGVDRLWGYYEMLSGLIHLEIAYASSDKEWWVSNKVAVFGDSNFRLQGTGPLGVVWSGGDTFTHFDRANFLLGSVELENLSFGVVIPYIFANVHYSGNNMADGTTGDFPKALNPSDGHGHNLLEDAMKNAVIGFKFTMQPVEVAGQFQMGTYGTYIGLKWEFVPTLSAGLSFMGIFKDAKLMKFGGGVTFAPDAFGVTVNASYGANLNSQETVIGIEPGFFYNVIPTHLRFQTDVGFYFTKASKDAKLDVIWAIQPQLFWNFLGTGAGSYWGVNTGMVVRYRLVSDPQEANAVDVTFKWAF